MGTSLPSRSLRTRGITAAAALPLGYWWNLSLGYFARSLPLRGGPSVEALPGPSFPCNQISCVFRSTPRVSRVLPVRIGAGVYSGAVRTSQSFGRHPPPPFFFHPYFIFSSLLSFSFSSQMSHMQTESYIVRQHKNIIWEHFTCKTCLKILWKGLVKIITHSKG